MAEFCLECWNRLHHTQETSQEVTLTNYLDLCEGCGEMKQVVQASSWVGKTKKRYVLWYLFRGIFVSVWRRICSLFDRVRS